MATIQIAIAVYNDAAYLERTLKALHVQTFRDFHVTVLDDGSTDDSRAVAERFASLLSVEVIAAEHRGRQAAKLAVAQRTEQRSPFWMVLDSDIELGPTALADMLALLRQRPEVGVVCARARAFEGRRYGAAQALIEDLFYDSIEATDGTVKWIVGGCALFRREAFEGVVRHPDIPEDNDLSKQMAGRWRFLAPRAIPAAHLGVPTTLGGLLTRGLRDGMRVAALLAAHPTERTVGNMARLVPLPLAGLLVLGGITMNPWLSGLAGIGLGGYVLAFAVATRRQPASPWQRLSAGATFCFMNVGFGYGYLRASLRSSEALSEPVRGT